MVGLQPKVMSTSLVPGSDKKMLTTKNLLIRIFYIDLNSPATTRNAAILVPLAFGLWSVLLGADSNWDLQNYHLYNAFALLNDKLKIDFAPGGFQSYFNPILDLPYYFAITHLPPRLVGFLMGVAHGLNFVLVLKICRRVLHTLPQADKYRIPLLLALAGCLTVNFLSGLGNTMGDNMTSLFCLSSLLIILQTWQRSRTASDFSFLMLLAAGLLMGMGTGLKLTNAIYAVALCAGLLTFPMPLMSRIKIAFIFGIGVLAGLACASGYWFYTMWQTFGNPLFPQFGSFFPNAVAASISVADNSWLPKELTEQLLWPFIISADAQKVGQLAVRQIIWAIIYVLIIMVTFATVFYPRSTRHGTGIDPSARYVIVVIVIGFVLWMKLFSIYRYLVPIELLTSLAIFILLNRLLPHAKAWRTSAWVITLATLVVLIGGVKTWGHKPWSDKSFYVEVPPISEPERTTILITEGNPWSWLALAFPSQVAFTQIDGNFPQGPGFVPHIKNMLTRRGGETFGLFQGHYDGSIDRADKVRSVAVSLGLTKSSLGCGILGVIAEKFKLAAVVDADRGFMQETSCTIQPLAREKEKNIESKNQAEREKAQSVLAPYNLNILPQTCSLHRAGIGDSVEIYQWCQLGSDNMQFNVIN
jgi:hypothetical protein